MFGRGREERFGQSARAVWRFRQDTAPEQRKRSEPVMASSVAAMEDLADVREPIGLIGGDLTSHWPTGGVDRTRMVAPAVDHLEITS
jgi:hypothetical protein